jgi:hypothetical protein
MKEWLLKLFGMKTPKEDSSIEEEARYVIEKEERPLLINMIRAIPYGINIFFYAILVPYLLTKYTGFNIIWFGLVVVFLAMTLHLIKSDYQLKARKWWALKSLEVYENSQELFTKYQKLNDNLKKGSEQLQSLTSALDTLSAILKYNILEKCSIRNFDDKMMQIELSKRIPTLRNEIKNLCKYICEILESGNHLELRCGIIIEDPNDTNKLIPLVVYNPQDEEYVSKLEFTKDDFSGKLISHFKEHSNRKDWKNYAIHIIEDVEEFKSQSSRETFNPISLRQHQSYIKSIAGNVIYFRNKNKKVEVLGVINIDSNLTSGIKKEKYTALQPYLFPAFRLLAERLLIIKKYPTLIQSIWQNE